MRKILTTSLLTLGATVMALTACGNTPKPATVVTAKPTPPPAFVRAVSAGGYTTLTYELEGNEWEALTNVNNCRIELDYIPTGYAVEEVGSLDKANKVLHNPVNMSAQQLRKAINSLPKASRNMIDC